MRGRSWKTPPPSQYVPHNSASQPGDDHELSYIFQPDHAFADGLGYRRSQEPRGNKVADRGQQHGFPWRKDASGHDSCNAVGGIMKAIQEIKYESSSDGDG